MGVWQGIKDLWNAPVNFDPYAPVGAIRQVGGDIADAAKSPGYDTAAQGAREAQAYLQQLSQTAWDRQMQGLQGALGQFQGYDALKAQLIPSHANPGGGMPGGPGAGSGGGRSGPPAGAPPVLPPPTAPTAKTGFSPPGGPGWSPATPGSMPGTTGYSPPGGPGWTPVGSPPGAPPELPAPAPPPVLPPPGAPPSLAPPGMPTGAPPSLPPPGGAVTPNILSMLSAMTRSGRGAF